MRFDSPFNYGPSHFGGSDIDFDEVSEHTTQTLPVPTEAQMGFIRSLRADWQEAEDELARLESRPAVRPAWKDPQDIAAASEMIDNGKAARTAIRVKLTEARRASRIVVKPGLYVIGDDIATAEVFKIQKVRDEDRLYAKILTSSGWDYMGARPMTRIAHEGHLMTADEAAWLGKDANSPLAGVCVSCSRDLTDETSMFYGYGEICAEHHGWPYVKGAERA